MARHDNGARHAAAPIIFGAVVVAATVAAIGIGRHEARPRHPADSAPGRTARRHAFGGYAVTGKTVTIARPRAEVFAFVRAFDNLAKAMEHVAGVSEDGQGTTTWRIALPLGQEADVATRIVGEQENEMISWKSVEGAAIAMEGKILFRDAPGGRGTEVEAVVAWKPPAGDLGKLAAKLVTLDPRTQGRRNMKRIKMLMETGEIATATNRNPAT